MREKIEKILDEIRPFLRADGGDVELVEVNGGVVKVRLTGACGGCPMANLTLRNTVTEVIKKKAPEVKEVIAV